ncbi:MAG: heterodisulfide reductase [Methanobacteriales archaeon HGW-Methanobacteriales-1]|jgi:heterodisulfide reductase subunit B|nr:MAG: heterodisulfide reductase [Methanobacteriales archaeon HGW-Methanobacteriales-1]
MGNSDNNNPNSNNETIIVPDNNYYLFKSCTAGSFYPGIELSTRYILDILEVDYTNDSEHSSCTGHAVHLGAIPLETNMALNARNLSLASESGNKNITTICPTSYFNLKHNQKLISKDKKLEKKIKKIMDEIGRKYDYSLDIFHISDILMEHIDSLLEITSEKHDFQYSDLNIKAVTHHGCHYAKFFYKEITKGTYEKPEILDEILKKFKIDILEYSENFLCCGNGLHGMVAGDEYSKETLIRKIGSIHEVKPDVIITHCPGCTFTLDYYQDARIQDDLTNEFDENSIYSENKGLKDLNDLNRISDDKIPVLYISELLAIIMGANPEEIGLEMHMVSLEPFLKKLKSQKSKIRGVKGV